MNIPIRIKGGDANLEAVFIAEADRKGLVELKGHRCVRLVYKISHLRAHTDLWEACVLLCIMHLLQKV